MEALATITSVKGLVVALQSIRTNHKLPCAVTFDPSSGLKLRFLDGGHAMQSGISLSTSVRWGWLGAWMALNSAAGQADSEHGLRAVRRNVPHAHQLLHFWGHGRCTHPSYARPLPAPWPRITLQVFSYFQAPAPLTFFVPLSVLLESINTVASSMPQELHLQYPGPGGSLLITCVQEGCS